MSETTAQLIEKNLGSINMRIGDTITGTIIDIDGNWVTVDTGLKSSSVIPIEQFTTKGKTCDIQIGDQVKVILEAIEDGMGKTRLSREKARTAEVWDSLTTAYKGLTTVKGVIGGKIKGGFIVFIDTVRGFLPGSLADNATTSDTEHPDNSELEFKIVKLDREHNNVVLSRRAVLDEINSSERKKIIDQIVEGSVVEGTVKNLTDYGAFIDLGGIDGLLHITDMAWERIDNISSLMLVGQKVTVKVLKFDRNGERISLGMKQLQQDPWGNIEERFTVGTQLTGKVSNIADYGFFVEVERGVEGLVHVSEIDWTNKNVSPYNVVKRGQNCDVIVLDVTSDRRRLSLSMKQCMPNPWDDFSKKYKKGHRVKGKICSIMDFGIFVRLEGSIDGLVHISDIALSQEESEKQLRQYNKGDEIEAIILGIDVTRERIGLGISQLNDPFIAYVSTHDIGSEVEGKIIEVDRAYATVELEKNVHGIIKASEISQNAVFDVREIFSVNNTVEVEIISINRNDRSINLSVKSVDSKKEKKLLEELRQRQSEEQSTATLGTLIANQQDINKK